MLELIGLYSLGSLGVVDQVLPTAGDTVFLYISS